MNVPTHPEKPELVLNYRTLKSGKVFTLLWFSLGIAAIFGSLQGFFAIEDKHRLVLAVTALCCILLGLYSLYSSFGPFLLFYKNHLTINHSIFRKRYLSFADITRIDIALEEVAFHRGKGSPVILNLANLSFADQEVCLDRINQLMADILTRKEMKPADTGNEAPQE